MTTNPNLDQAREWAEYLTAQRNVYGDKTVEARAAAEVINALPDTIVDGDKLREFIEEWRTDCPAGDGPQILEQLETFLPDPQPRTLADMTPEEREACQWMQADYLDKDTGLTTRVIITRADQRIADTVFPSGVVSCVYNDELTPLPGRPRMVWPDEHYLTAEEDMSIIPPKIDTSTGHDDSVDMTPEEVPAGEAWIVTYLGDECVGVRNGTNIGSSGTIWSLASMEDTRTRWGHDSEITLVSRLVPEVKP